MKALFLSHDLSKDMIAARLGEGADFTTLC